MADFKLQCISYVCQLQQTFFVLINKLNVQVAIPWHWQWFELRAKPPKYYGISRLKCSQVGEQRVTHDDDNNVAVDCCMLLLTWLTNR